MFGVCTAAGRARAGCGNSPTIIARAGGVVVHALDHHHPATLRIASAPTKTLYG